MYDFNLLASINQTQRVVWNTNLGRNIAFTVIQIVGKTHPTKHFGNVRRIHYNMANRQAVWFSRDVDCVGAFFCFGAAEPGANRLR